MSQKTDDVDGGSNNDQITEIHTETTDNSGNDAINSRWIVYLVVFLLLARFIFPLILSLIIVVLTLIGSTIAGISLIQGPKREVNNLRSRFPRMRFTRQEEWTLHLQQIQQNETKSPEEEDDSQFIQNMGSIVDLIIRDFVLTWFQSISKSQAFPNEIKLQLKHVFSILEERASKLEIDKVIVLKLMPIITKHFNCFVMSEETVTGERNMSLSTDLDLQIAKEYDNVGRLNKGISLQTSDQERARKKYSNEKVSKLVPLILPSHEAGAAVVHILVRELLANVVMFPVIRLLADPDFWNQNIIKITSTVLKDRDNVRELRDVIDKQYHAPTSKSKNSKLTLNDRITPQMKQPEFERYIKGVDRSNSIPLLKQLKYYVAVQISRTERLKSKTDKFLKYKKRLNVAKTRIDARINTLTQQTPKLNEKKDSALLSKPDLDKFISKLTLSQILSNPSALSIFMEFMEQRSRTDLLQFWLTVNGIKDPLEDPLSPEYEEELLSSADIGGVEDLKLIFDQFFKRKILKIKSETYQEVEKFVTGDERSLESYLKCRKLILMLQMEVYERMQDRDLPDFKNSDLFLKLLSSESFEESLVREVDVYGENENDSDYEEDDDGESQVNTESLTEIENALSNILVQDKSLVPSRSETPKSNNTEKLKSEIFGNNDEGFLDEKPLFDNESEFEGIDEDDKLDVDTEFFKTSHDVFDLKQAIEDLEKDIEKLKTQSSLLDPLILKAELIDNAGELRVLRKSKSSYEREIEAKELQRQQLIVQDSENSLFGKTKIAITNWVKGSSGGKEYIVYVIEIQRLPTKEGDSITSWVIGRRFSQFYKINDILHHDIPAMSTIPFPKKKIVLKFQQKSLIDERRHQLETYLNQLLCIPQVCQHKEFRKFLTVDNYSVSPEYNIPPTSSSRFEIKGAANKLYSGLYSGIDMISSRSASSDNLNKFSETDQAQVSSSASGNGAEDVEELRKELEFYENQQDRIENKSYVKPVTDLFIALFPLNSPNSWLRGRAIIVVLQQVFGSTIEKHIKGQIANFTTKEKVEDLTKTLRGILWPEGKFMEAGEPRTSREKIKAKTDSRALLESLFIDTCSRIVGQSSSRLASNRIHSMLQNEILNTNLVYEIIDLLLVELFPELNDADANADDGTI